ncbi:SET domain-containing protein [Hesseltinella vesiculosa]|uniref:Histone-lysine N-methyltransferase n=1 Tax=Hesseltinella vesiculosa TaxID=101127 RepID=A0A1X2G5K1_9FUNG|nr:SET domain-containing protein [Hesseltinella vesiculosa]
MYYLIEWTGYQPEDNTWEAEENLMGNKGLIADFKEAYSKQHPHTKFHGDRSVGVRRLVLQGVYDPDTKRHSPTFEQKHKYVIDSLFLFFFSRSQGHELIFDQHGNMTFKNVTPKVTVVNEIDDTSFPEQFVFIDKLVFSKRVSVPDPDFLIGCECQHSCLKTNNEECHEEWTYDSRGKLKPGCTGPLYECNLACQCKASCPNRVVQRGRTVALEIFQTKSKGWGVRCKTKIMANSFVEEYLGEVITEAQGEARGTIYDRIGVSYLFDMDSAVTEGTTAKYVIDSYVCGNASHFFNHSCNPNLTVFGVYHDSGDPYFHRLAFFALRDIEAGEELTFDYLGSHGLLPSNTHAQQRIECLCDDNACRGFIHS